ncbi:hypothetical protein [Sphingopyxis sp.]|uniref:hypothetical protein n=1 Tax=Sphingopyxis sp. TaxID=1908224 RepID=UPI001D494286|nr:hypothetical protein [Sphingopyxis sp.]MBW8297892.1 hypothetical protein [Sphingopyxis sp.]
MIAEFKKRKLRCPNGGLVFAASNGEVQDYGNLLRRKFYPLQIKAGVCDPLIKNGEPLFDAKGAAAMDSP